MENWPNIKTGSPAGNSRSVIKIESHNTSGSINSFPDLSLHKIHSGCCFWKSYLRSTRIVDCYA